MSLPPLPSQLKQAGRETRTTLAGLAESMRALRGVWRDEPETPETRTRGLQGLGPERNEGMLVLQAERHRPKEPMAPEVHAAFNAARGGVRILPQTGRAAALGN